MGAYENPNINIGVDTQSGQLIGKAIADFGAGIARGVDASSKILAEATARERKNKKENREREMRNGIQLSEDVAGVGTKQTIVTGNIQDSTQVMATKGFLGDGGVFVPPLTEALNRISAGTGTEDDFKRKAQWGSYLTNTGTRAADTTAFFSAVGDIPQNRISNKLSSSRLIDIGNGNINELKTVPGYNKKDGFYNKQIATLRNGETFEYSVDSMGEELKVSLNDTNSNHYGTSKDFIITVPEFGKASSLAFQQGGMLLKNKVGVEAITSEFLLEPIKGSDSDKKGFFETTIAVPDLIKIEASALEDATATIETEVGLPYGVTTANAWMDDYIGKNKSLQIPIASSYRDEDGRIIENAPTETITIPEDGLFLKPITDLKHPDDDIYKTSNGVLLSKKALEDYQKILAFSNVTKTGAYQNGIEKDVQNRRKYIKTFGTNTPNKKDYIDLRIKNTKKIYDLGANTPDGGNKFASGRDATNYSFNKETRTAKGGAGEFLQTLRKTGKYKTDVLDKFIPVHDGSAFADTILSDIRKAVIGTNADEMFDGNKDMPYDKIVKEGQKTIIDAAVNKKLKENRFQDKMNLGYVYDRKTGSVINTSEMVNLIAERNPQAIKKID